MSFTEIVNSSPPNMTERWEVDTPSIVQHGNSSQHIYELDQHELQHHSEVDTSSTPQIVDNISKDYHLYI